MVQNVHDKTYRLLLSNKGEVLEILQKIIPIGEKLSNVEIEKCNTKFVTENYEYREADIVYRIKNTNVYILIEHQSTVNNKMLCRTKEYCERIITDTKDNKDGKTKLSIVIPIVLYTGKGKWNALKEYEGAKVVGLRHSYYVIDINELNAEELLKSTSLLENILGVEKLKDKEIYKTVLKIAQKQKRKGDKEIMEKLIRNEFAEILTEEQIKQIIEDINKKESDETMTIGERAIRGVKQIAKKEGRIEGINYVAQEMLKKCIPIKTIVDVTKLKEEELEQMQKQIAVNE